VRVVGALALIAVAASASCGGDSQTYSLEETKAAFARHGYVLVHPGPAQFPNVPEGVVIPESYLVPKAGPRFMVIVGSDAEADAAWRDYDRLQDADSFDACRANIVVVSDDGPPARERRRVLAALATLPDRGLPVEIAGS
jgi:hypothetical protein